MKNKAFLNLLILLLFQVSFSQKKDVKIIIKEASEAFNNNDYERALQKIDEIKIAFKTNTPPPFILSMEIISKSEIIKNNPLDSFDLITDTRNLANRYLKNPNSKKDTNYNGVVLKNELLKTYPKDLSTHNELKEAALIKEREEREELGRQERLKQEAIAIKARQEREALSNLLNGDGNDKTGGDNGKENGDTNATGYEGIGNGSGHGVRTGSVYGNGNEKVNGTGNGNYQLGKRKALNKPQPNYICNEEGTVVVQILVDKTGRVISANTGIRGTTNAAKCLLEQAKTAAMNTKWQPDNGAPDKQVGKIIYNFKLSQ